MASFRSIVLVFNTYENGNYISGASNLAETSYNYKMGDVGKSGNSYAIVTFTNNREKLPLSVVKKNIDKFIKYAERHPAIQFKVTTFAQFSNLDIGPMFALSPANIMLPLAWKKYVMHERDNKDYW